jgi:hypothetical protein
VTGSFLGIAARYSSAATRTHSVNPSTCSTAHR